MKATNIFLTRTSIFILLIFLLIGCDNQPDIENIGDGNYLYIENKGSDTMVNIALAWAEQYQQLHPETQISVTGGGSGTGIAALINGTVDIANASRQIKPEETEQIEQNGNIPVEFVVARDAIAVIVNPNNPINKLTIPQISAIYTGEINNWSELGGEDRPIVRLSREVNSGTHVYFLEEVIRMGGDDDSLMFSTDTLLLPSSEGITTEVSQNPNAIGYDGLGYVTPDTKVVAIARDYNSTYYLPTVDTVNNGKYPIARDLYMYTVDDPIGVVKTYLEWIFTTEAQDIVKQQGFVPINTSK